MSLTLLTPLAFALGLAGVAGALYLLQRLRVRHEELPVVTTLFWREAVEESRARTLTERFRHPLAYLLALAIAGLLLLVFAGPRVFDRDGRQYTVLLDGSAGMARPGRFDAALDQLRATVAQLPRDRTEVLWCGGRVESLLLAGEERALLGERLADLAPVAAPSTVDAAVRALSELHAGSGQAERTAVVIGDAPLDPGWVDGLPAGFELQRAAPESRPAEGAGIVALGVAPAASGAWSRVDVLVTLAGPEADAASLSVALDGAPLDGAALEGGASSSTERTALESGEVRVLLRDLPAEGGRLELALAPGDDLTLDDRAAIDLPRRPRIRVAVEEDTSGGLDAVAAVLAVDDAVELVAGGDGADVVVTRSSATTDPALVFAPEATQAEALLVTHREELDSFAVLERAVGELGLDRIDGGELAARGGAAIAVGARPGPARQVSLWHELLDGERFGFTESRAFPVVVARSVRWLAEVEPLVPYARVDARLPSRVGAWRDVAGARVPATAGELVLADGSRRAVALLDRATTSPQPDLAGFDLPGVEPDGWSVATWLLLLVLALVALEWFLFRRGRMP